MTELRYETPDTLDAAVSLLAAESGVARVLAGGTDVLVQMHADMIEPELLVDIKKIAELREIKKEGGAYRFGAAVPGKELMLHEDFNKTWPGVMDGVRLIGSLQIRGRASVGGNLCNASPAADGVPPMIAASAIASVIGPKGVARGADRRDRDGPWSDIIGQRRDRGVVPAAGTCAPFGRRLSAFHAADRDGHCRGRGGINLTLDDGGNCIAARVVLGAVAERALIVDEAADALIGTTVDARALEKLSAAASAACRPIDDKRGTIEFRTKVAGVLAERAAVVALERAG